MAEYLEFRVLEKKQKTLLVGVFSKRHGDRLGVIRWYGPWRRYAFHPESETIFDKQCMMDICERITILEKGRLKEKALESMSLSELMGIYTDTMPENVARECKKAGGQ